MKLNLTKQEVEQLIKESYKQSCYLEVDKSIEKVEINEYAEDKDKFCIITLVDSKLKELKHGK